MRPLLLGLVGLIATGACALAQIELSEQPALGGKSRLVRLRQRLDTVREQDKDRARRAQNESGWRARQQALSERADILTNQRAQRVQDAAPSEADRTWTALSGAGPDATPITAQLPLLEVVDDGGYQEGYLAPGIHPAELKALDALIATIDRLQHRYDSLLHHLFEEQTQLSRAEAQSRTLIEQLELEAAKVAEPSTRAVSLTEVERLVLESDQAGIDHTLAEQRARQDEGAGDAPPIPPAPPQTPPEPLQPPAAFESSLKRTEAMRAEQTRLLRELGTLQPQLVTAVRQANLAVKLAHETEVEVAARVHTRREAALMTSLKRLRATKKDRALARAALKSTRARQASREAEIQARLDALRLSEPDTPHDKATRDDPLSEHRVHRLERATLTEERAHLKAAVDRDAFRVDLALTINDVIQGEPPERAFFAERPHLQTARASRANKQAIRRRCDSWRKERSAAQAASATEATQIDRKARALSAYAALADLCMRQEWVLDAQERLARIARFHLEQQARGSRNAWWYIWRGLVSLLAALLLMLLTRWIGQVTHRLARPDRAEPAASRTKATEPAQVTWKARVAKVRGTAALTVYLGMAGSLWFFTSALVVEYVWQHPVRWITWLSWVTYPLLTIGGNPVSLWTIFGILMWIVGALWLARLFQGFLSEGLMDHFAVQRGVRDVVGTLARYLVILLGIIFGLSSAGIPLTALAAVFGVLGIGIGFGLQNIASNFISGFIILIERPFRRGDYIQVGDMVGEVKEIRARATTIETRNAVTVVVPNSEFVTGQVINWTLGHNERLRTNVNVGVAYGSDLQQVTRILLDVGRAHADVLGWPGPRVEMVGFGDSSIDFVLHVWTRRLRTLPGLRSDLYLAIERRFREASIEIPFPIRTVLLPGEPAPSEEGSTQPTEEG